LSGKLTQAARPKFKSHRRPKHKQVIVRFLSHHRSASFIGNFNPMIIPLVIAPA
jgi:hypothetical protein